MADFILPFQIESASFRGRIVRLETVIDEILKPHGYPPVVEQLCAEMCVLCGLLSSMLKYDGVFTLQAQGDGPIKMMVCDMASNGDMRACASFDEEALSAQKEADLSLFGKGYLAFTVDQGAHAERYQGIVELKGQSLSDSVQHYFASSEQIQTGIMTASAPGDTGTWMGQGILLQHMPEEGGTAAPIGNVDEDDWRRVMILMQSVTPEELLDPSLSAEDILTRLFHEEGVRVYDRVDLRKNCRCSRERLHDVLKTLPADDIAHATKDGVIDMRCEFCGTIYQFDPADYA